MPHYYPIVLQGGKSLAGDSLGFHAYSLRIDNLSNQWLLEETSLAWIPPYSLGTCLRLYGTGVAILLNQAPIGQPQLAPVVGEQTVGVYSDQLRTEVAGTPVRQFTLVQAVSDLTEGPQPALPPVGVDRLYADPAGNIHHLHSDGTDLTLVDPSNAGTLLYPTFDPHYQALMSATAVGGDSSGSVGNIANNAAHVPFRVGAAGGVQNTATVPLTLPGVQGGPFNSIYWTDQGAGPASIALNSYGGIPGNNLMRFMVPSGTSGTGVPVLQLDGTARTMLNGPLTFTQVQSTARPDISIPGLSGGVQASIQWRDAGAGVTSIAGNTSGGQPTLCVLRFDIANGSSGGAMTALTLDGTGRASTPLLQVTSGFPSVLLPGRAGGLAATLQWTDVGAGYMQLVINSYGGIPQNNVMRFDVANGTAGSWVPGVLTLDGAGRALVPGDTLMGAGNVSPAITSGFPYFPYSGGAPSGVPAWAAATAMVPMIFGPSLRMYAYLSGAWHFVQFT